jgi:hypothetical protein
MCVSLIPVVTRTAYQRRKSASFKNQCKQTALKEAVIPGAPNGIWSRVFKVSIGNAASCTGTYRRDVAFKLQSTGCVLFRVSRWFCWEILLEVFNMKACS